MIKFISVLFLLSPGPLLAQWTPPEVRPMGGMTLAVQGKSIFSAYPALAGTIYRSEDTGRSWHECDTGMTRTGALVLYGDDSLLLAGTYSYGIFRSTDRG